MPGFPVKSAEKIMNGLFNAARSAGATDQLKLYANTTNATTVFPRATTSNNTPFGDGSTTTSSTFVAPGTQTTAADGAAVDLYVGLIKGTNAVLADDNFSSTGAIVSQNGTGTASAPNSGLGEADYSGYKRVRITSTTTTAGAGTALPAAVTAASNGGVQLSSVSIASQLTFPTCAVGAGGANANAGSAVTNNIVGFFISSNPQTQAQTGVGLTHIDIIAYGALSSVRSITASDTPIFTPNAITITLD
jgi:hypothetical protein